MEVFLKQIGSVTAAVLPLFNIPLVLRMIKRKSSEDISLIWAVGVWVCILLMAPAGFMSEDTTFKIFTISNLLLFTLVFFTAVKYRKKQINDK